MRKSSIAALAALACTQAVAGGYGLKPGLWETKVIKNVVDGKDRTAEMVGANSKMSQMMANMPPEQRARIEAAMKQNGLGLDKNGSTKICISPELANMERPTTGREGRCKSPSISHVGNHTSYTAECTNPDGSTSFMKGEVTALGDLITHQMDMTRKTAGGETHVNHMESEMHFLGADCGDVKPVPVPKPAS